MLRTNTNIAFSVRVSCGVVREVSAQGDRWAEKGAWLIELETMPDHVHRLVEVDPQFGIHRLTKAIKGRTSRVLREEYPWLKTKLPALWTNSYFVAAVGGAPLDVVKRYVEQQKAR